MKQQGMIGKRWVGGTVVVLGVALLVVGMTVHAYPQPSEEEDRAERERDGFDTDAIRQRMGIDAMGNPIPAEALDGIVESAAGLREARPQPERSVIGARDSTGVGIMGSGNPRTFERNQCTASGGDWDWARNQCSYARLTCEDMGFNWSGSSCDPGDFGGGGGSVISAGSRTFPMYTSDTASNNEFRASTGERCNYGLGRPRCSTPAGDLGPFLATERYNRPWQPYVPACNWGGSPIVTSVTTIYDDGYDSTQKYSYLCY